MAEIRNKMYIVLVLTLQDATSSSDDEDERQEALRLQKVRAKKLQQMV